MIEKEETETTSAVQTQIDLLMNEVKEYADVEIQFLDNWVEIRSVHHLKKLRKKGVLDIAIGLEKRVLKATKTQSVSEALQRRSYLVDLMKVKKSTTIYDELR